MINRFLSLGNARLVPCLPYTIFFLPQITTNKPLISFFAPFLLKIVSLYVQKV